MSKKNKKTINRISQELYSRGVTGNIIYDSHEKIGKVELASGKKMPILNGNLIDIEADDIRWLEKGSCPFCNAFNVYNNGKKELYVIKKGNPIKMDSVDKKTIDNILDPPLMKATRLGTYVATAGMIITTLGLAVSNVIPMESAAAFAVGAYTARLIPRYLLGKYAEKCKPHLEDVLKI